MKKHISLFCSVLPVLSLLLPVFSIGSFAAEWTLKTDKDTYVRGEPIMVTATGSGSDWVGIYKKDDIKDTDAETPVGGSIYYYYIDKEGHTSGTAFYINNVDDKYAYPNPDADMQEWLALPAGTYTLCLCDNDSYRIRLRKDITVVENPDAPEEPELVKSVKTDSNVYVEGEPIYVTATGDKKDWVGIYPKDWVSDSDERVNARSIYYYYVAQDGHTSGTAFYINNVEDEYAHPNPDGDMQEWLALPAGTYTLCLCENDDYKILDRVDIEVKASADVNGYVQTRTGKAEGTQDMRVLAEVSVETLERIESATLKVSFVTADGKNPEYTMVAKDAYTSVVANGETVDARTGYAFIGVVIEGIRGATSVSATITFSDGTEICLGSAKLG